MWIRSVLAEDGTGQANFGFLAVPAAIFIRSFTNKSGILLELALYAVGATLRAQGLVHEFSTSPCAGLAKLKPIARRTCSLYSFQWLSAEGAYACKSYAHKNVSKPQRFHIRSIFLLTKPMYVPRMKLAVSI